MDNYASFISEALEKTKCRECVPSWEEIQMLMSREEMLCTVHYPGPGSCQLYISSHTTANEVCNHYKVFHCCGSAFPTLFQSRVDSLSLHCVLRRQITIIPDTTFLTLTLTCLFALYHQVIRRIQEKLGLLESKNTFALFEHNALWEQPVAGSALIADVLTRLDCVFKYVLSKKFHICSSVHLWVRGQIFQKKLNTICPNAELTGQHTGL